MNGWSGCEEWEEKTRMGRNPDFLITPSFPLLSFERLRTERAPRAVTCNAPFSPHSASRFSSARINLLARSETRFCRVLGIEHGPEGKKIPAQRSGYAGFDCSFKGDSLDESQSPSLHEAAWNLKPRIEIGSHIDQSDLRSERLESPPFAGSCQLRF